MTKTWFTADTHFGHVNIVSICDRPFGDPADRAAWREAKTAGELSDLHRRARLEQACHEMDEEMIRRWNEVVSPKDDVWHLGDFCLSRKRPADDWIRRLNGRLHLVRGNHDGEDTYAHPRWTFSRHYAEHRTEKTDLVLCHYAMRVWNGSFKSKTFQLFGHSHGMLKDVGAMQCDVGVDCWDFRPVSLDQIKERLHAKA